MIEPHQMANPTTYVLGFAFSLQNTALRVCLMEKRRPMWQAGKLNGVGGKCEPGEMPATSMAREFAEETGVKTAPADWTKFFVMRFGNGAVVHCYTSRLPDDQTPSTQEDEHVGLYQIGRSGRWYLHHRIIPNLNWLIPMAYHELLMTPGERMLLEGE